MASSRRPGATGQLAGLDAADVALNRQRFSSAGPTGSPASLPTPQGPPLTSVGGEPETGVTETPAAPAPTEMDCGQQFRLPGRRRTVGPGVAAQEKFRQKRVERFDADYLIKAGDHSAGRNNGTARLLALLSFLRNLKVIPAACPVEWDRAHVQAIKGDEYSDAAHHLPCQILIDHRLPWELTEQKQVDIPAIIRDLRRLFGDVWVLPKEFNAADSIAEAHCLRGALVAACTAVISQTKPIRREAGVVKRGVGADYGTILLSTAELRNPTAGIDHKAVTEAYTLWVTKSIAAFRRAIDEVQANGTTVRGEDRTDDVVYILERYIRFAGVRPALFAGNNLAQLEEGLWLASEGLTSGRRTTRGATGAT